MKSHSFDELTSEGAGRSRLGPSLPASPGFPCLDPRAAQLALVRLEQLSSRSAVGPSTEREELATRGHCQLGLLLVSITLQREESRGSWARSLPGQDSMASHSRPLPLAPRVSRPRVRVKRASSVAPGARLWAWACLTWSPFQLCSTAGTTRHLLPSPVA